MARTHGNNETSLPIFQMETDDVSSQKLLNIFPNEIWQMILDHLTTDVLNDQSDTLENLSNSAPFFRNWLQPQRPLFLFPKVWPLLKPAFMDTCEAHHLKTASQHGIMTYKRICGTRCKSCRKWRHPRMYSGMLNLRLVSKTWNTAIDNLSQTGQHLDWLELGYICKSEDAPYESVWNKETFSSKDSHISGNTIKFIKHFEKSHGPGGDTKRSPFISRSVNLTQRLQDFTVEEQYSISHLLQLFGQHIWNCRISFQSEQPKNSAYTKLYKLREWLRKMPNLKNLSIDYLESDQDDQDYLKSGFGTFKLPNLTNLQFLSVNNLSDPIFENLIREKNHLTILEHRPYFNSKIISRLDSLPSLEQASMSFNICETRQFFDLLRLQWNVTKLHLEFDGKMKSFIRWTQVFDLLEELGNSLKDLVLRLPKAKGKRDDERVMKDCSKFELNLPRIESLKLIVGNYTTFDFILPMKNTLKALDIHVDYFYGHLSKHEAWFDIQKNQKIKILGYFEKMQESNIWQEFVKLKEINVSEEIDESTGKPIRSVEYTRNN